MWVQQSCLIIRRGNFWTGPGKGSGAGFPLAEWQGKHGREDCQKIWGAGLTEGTPFFSWERAALKKGHFPGHSQLPEEAPAVPECKTRSRRQNANSHQMKRGCVHYPEHGFLPLAVSSGCLVIWHTLWPLYIEQPNSPVSLPFSSLEEDRWWVVNDAQASFWPHRGPCCPSLQVLPSGVLLLPPISPNPPPWLLCLCSLNNAGLKHL